MDEKDVEKYIEGVSNYLISGADIEKFFEKHIQAANIDKAREDFLRASVKTDLVAKQTEEITEFFDAIKDLILDRFNELADKYEGHVNTTSELETSRIADLASEKLKNALALMRSTLSIQEAERLMENFNVRAKLVKELVEEALKHIFNWMYLRGYMPKRIEDFLIEIPDLEPEINDYIGKSLVKPREIWEQR